MRSKSKLKTILSTIFAFLLTLFIVSFYILIGINLGLLGDKSITRALNASDYYNEVHSALTGYCEELVTETGLPSTVLEDVITSQRLYIAGKNYIAQVLRGEEPDIKTDKLVNRFKENIDLYLQQENISQTVQLQDATTELITAIEAVYKEAVEFQLTDYITEYRNQFINLTRIFLPLVIVFSGVVCYFIIRLHKYRHRGLRYIVYALMAASLLTILTALFLLITKYYSGIEATPDYYKTFLMQYFRWSILIFVYIGGIGLTLSVALMALVSYLKNRIMNK